MDWQKAVGTQSQAHSIAPAIPVTALLPAVPSLCPQAAPGFTFSPLCLFVDLAIGLLPQPFYSWIPALDDLILFPKHCFLEHISLLRARSHPLPVPHPQQKSLPSKSQIFIGRVISPSAFLTGPLNKPEQLKPTGTILTPRSPAPGCEGNPHMDALRGHTCLQCPPQALPTTLPGPHPLPAPLYLSPPS